MLLSASSPAPSASPSKLERREGGGEGMAEKKGKKERVWEEFVETERNFVEKMQICLEDYCWPLQAKLFSFFFPFIIDFFFLSFFKKYLFFQVSQRVN